MKSEGEKTNNSEKRITAEELRQSIALKQAAKVDEALKKRTDADRELERFFLEFMESQISQKEIDQIRQKVLSATDRGELEVQIMRFPSKLCTDNGRTINNGESDWPKTLQGKARSLYNLFEERGRPQGFKLKALILEFPGGIPGDVGLFLNWE
jgi:hypothetical protein